MIGVTIEGDRVTVVTENGQRQFQLIPGAEYVVEPPNPRKMKHRGRYCVFIDHISLEHDTKRPPKAKVKFLDNNRVGRVAYEDLVPVSEEAKVI